MKMLRTSTRLFRETKYCEVKCAKMCRCGASQRADEFLQKKLDSATVMEMEKKYSCQNYAPIPVVFSSARGAKVTDPEGKEYFDFLSAYSAVNQGHMHPRIVAAMRKQLDSISLSARAFYNDKFGAYAKFVTEYFGYEKVLPMNTGAEAVESAIKLCRKWAYMAGGYPVNEGNIIVCDNNFHGRTTTIISFSNDPEGHDYYGPFTPGFVSVPYNNIPALEKAFAETKNVIGFLVEPIQGEAGVMVPEVGYLAKAKAICAKNKALLIADEIQTGIARTGKLLCHYYDEVRPDIVLLGKALSGGLYPVSAVLSDAHIMDVIKPGTHGSTFGGNPLGCAVAMEALQVVLDEGLTHKAYVSGEQFRAGLKAVSEKWPQVKEVRGRGLLNALEVDEKLDHGHLAYSLTMKMRDNGLLAKPTHGNIIRFSPPLCVTQKDIEICLSIIQKSMADVFPKAH